MPTPPTCPACGSTDLFFDSDALSQICSHCGALSDPSQVVIDNAREPQEGYGQVLGADLATRALRNSDGSLVLSFQTTEVKRDLRRVARHKLIRNLLSALGRWSNGLSGRAEAIFDTAHHRAHFSWGSVRAEQVAAACVAVALREANLPESLGELSILLSQPVLGLARVYMRLKRLLALHLPATDAHTYLPVLTTHLRAALSGSPKISLPEATVNRIIGISSNSIHDWSSKILRLVARSRLAEGRHVAPVACAAVLLALETESETSLPGLKALAELLAARVGKRPYTVMERYHEIVKLLRAEKLQVETTSHNALAHHTTAEHDRGRAKKNRHTPWIKDVLLLTGGPVRPQVLREQPSMSSSPVDRAPPVGHRNIAVSTEPDAEGYDERAEAEYWSTLSSDDEDDFERNAAETSPPPSSLRRLITPKDLRMNNRSFRPPYSRPSRPSRRPAAPSKAVLGAATALLAPARSKLDPDHDAPARNLLLRTTMAPSTLAGTFGDGSRLSQLSAVRGGESLVEDDELFSEGELEAYLRSADTLGESSAG